MVLKWIVVTRYSGGTVWVLHPFPYSPQTVARGTLSCLIHHMLFYKINILCLMVLVLMFYSQKVKYKKMKIVVLLVFLYNLGIKIMGVLIMQSSNSQGDLFKRIEQQEKVACEFGFYWNHINQLLKQIKSECQEVDEAWQKNDRTHLQEEVGDLIHASVCLAIFCQLDPYETLRKSLDKFQKRYDQVVAMAQEDGLDHLRNQSMDLLMDYWGKAKQR